MSHLRGPIKMSLHELWAHWGQTQGIVCGRSEALWKWLARIYSLQSMRASLEGLFTKWISLNHSTVCSHSWQRARERGRVTDRERDGKWLYNQFKQCLCVFVSYLTPFSLHKKLHGLNTDMVCLIYVPIEQKQLYCNNGNMNQNMSIRKSI